MRSSRQVRGSWKTLLVAGGLGLALATSCGGSDSGGSGPSRTVIQGLVTDYDGKPVSGLYVTAERVDDPVHVDPQTVAGVRTAPDGSFALDVTSAGPRFAVTVLPERSGDGAIAYAPVVGVVRAKPGVMMYMLPLRVPAVRVFDATQGSIDVGTASRPMTLRATNARGTFYAARLDVEDGPPLDAKDAPSGTALQSAAMLYVQPAPGSDLPADGFAIDLGPPVPDVPDASPFASYRFDGDALWVQVEPAPPAAPPPIKNFGFWNDDRNFKTACVKGKLVGASGKTCAGQRVKQTGPDGISASDNAGADGSFCVTGAQTFPANLKIGGTSFSGKMPSTAGDCTAPETCADLGEVRVADADCPGAGAAPPPSGGSFSCDVPAAVSACSVATVQRICGKYGPGVCAATYGASRATFEHAMSTFCSAAALDTCCAQAKAAKASRQYKSASVDFLEFGPGGGAPTYCGFAGYCVPPVGTPDPDEKAACEKLAADLAACNAAAWPDFDAWNRYADACDAEQNP